MSNKGSALMGIGVASGETRAVEAAKKLSQVHYLKHQLQVQKAF